MYLRALLLVRLTFSRKRDVNLNYWGAPVKEDEIDTNVMETTGK